MPRYTERAIGAVTSATSVHHGVMPSTGPAAMSTNVVTVATAYAICTRGPGHRTMSVRLPTAASPARSGIWFTYSTSAMRIATGSEA